MSPRGGNDALRSRDEIPALEHEEVLEASKNLILRYTGERLCNFGAGMTVSNLVQLPFRIHGEGHERAFEYQALFDCGATATFGSKSLFVDKLGFKPSDKFVTVKNGDGSSQLSMGSVKGHSVHRL
jgi:hypothetical protein